MKLTRQQAIDALNTQEAKDVKLLTAFLIRRTKTLKDDEIVDNIDEVIDVISDNIKEIADQHPTDKEARDAAMRTLKLIAKSTKNPWDDKLVSILDVFM